MSRDTRPAETGSGAWSQPLVRHLAVIVAAKLAFLFLLWFAFFRLPDGAPQPGSDIHHHIAGSMETAIPTHNKEARP